MAEGTEVARSLIMSFTMSLAIFAPCFFLINSSVFFRLKFHIFF